MSQRNYHIPPRTTPPGRHPDPQQQASTEYLRQQIAQIYSGGARGIAPNPQLQPYPEPQTQATAHDTHATLETPAQDASTEVPESYAQTYNQASQTEAEPQAGYDWQTYHSAWQNYYQQYYARYYLQQRAQPAPQQTANGATSDNPYKELAGTMSGSTPEKKKKSSNPKVAAANELKDKLRDKVETRAKKAQASPHFKPIITAVIVGFLFLFLQFNRTIVAQAKYYISPGTLTNDGSSIIINPESVASVGNDPRIIIPKINVDVPVVYDEPSYDENKIQKALERGVVHYGSSALPGELGNNVIVGHSSNDLFDAGGYKFAFVLIDRLNNGDIFMINYQGKRYVYKVYNKAVINPSDFSLINITPDKPVVTLITCTPPGTALKRLLVQAEQISPAPNSDQVAQQPNQQGQQSLPSSMPGNSPTLFERIKNIF